MPSLDIMEFYFSNKKIIVPEEEMNWIKTRSVGLMLWGRWWMRLCKCVSFTNLGRSGKKYFKLWNSGTLPSIPQSPQLYLLTRHPCHLNPVLPPTLYTYNSQTFVSLSLTIRVPHKTPHPEPNLTPPSRVPRSPLFCHPSSVCSTPWLCFKPILSPASTLMFTASPRPSP